MNIHLGKGNDDAILTELLVDHEPDITFDHQTLHQTIDVDPEINIENQCAVAKILEHDKGFRVFEIFFVIGGAFHQYTSHLTHRGTIGDTHSYMGANPVICYRPVGDIFFKKATVRHKDMEIVTGSDSGAPGTDLFNLPE